jgi:stearoyl-CoA desaturase (Delta-9 desaturase)
VIAWASARWSAAKGVALDANHRIGSRVDKAFVLLGASLPLAGTIVAMALLWNHQAHWRDAAILAGMFCSTSLGITVGFHRMLAHRSFVARSGVRFALLALGCMAAHTDPLRWASVHLKHHAHPDTAGDPHSPLQGLFHSHYGWIFDGFSVEPERYGKWLMNDPMVLFFQRTYAAWAISGLIIPFLLGGWTGLLWGGLVRMCLSQHITWSVNSVCHTFGRHPFETGDRSRNQWLVGVLAFGEGWHNNHHAFPRSAFHGLRWWQIDVSGYLILALERMKLVSDMVRVPLEVQAARLSVGCDR